MVGIAQLVEHLVVVQDVAGSNPVTHPRDGFSTRMPKSFQGHDPENPNPLPRWIQAYSFLLHPLVTRTP